MLVVIQLAIRRLLQGGNPYTIYHVPWDVPLPYGPVMWAPLIVPSLLHADVRFVTLAGVLFVPIACGDLGGRVGRARRTRAGAGVAGRAAGAGAQPGAAAFRRGRPHAGLLAAARPARVARRPRSLVRRRGHRRPAHRRAHHDGVDRAGAADRRLVSRAHPIRADDRAARRRLPAALSCRSRSGTRARSSTACMAAIRASSKASSGRRPPGRSTPSASPERCCLHGWGAPWRSCRSSRCWPSTPPARRRCSRGRRPFRGSRSRCSPSA